MRFFDSIKLLFLKARAFELFTNSIKRKIIKAFSVLPEDIRHNAELVYMDLFPDSTRVPEIWEKVFSVYFTAHELEKRRAIIESLWKINTGGQTAVYLQNILQAIEPNIHVIENIPIKNPRDSNCFLLSICNSPTMVCGNKKSVCEYRIGDKSFVPSVLRNDISELYSIPDDTNYWGTCFYVCQSAERDRYKRIKFIRRIKVDIKWKNYIEYFILRLKPVHTTAILYIEWEEKLNDKN